MKTINKLQITRNLAIIAIALFTTVSFSNATTIKGRIIDKLNEPINYATATLIHPLTKTIIVGDMSDSQGHFIIEGVKPGEYIISFRIVGYATDETRRIIVKDNYEIVDIKDINLREAEIALNELEVISAKEPAQLDKKALSAL